MEHFSELWYMFKEGMNKNEVGYQTCGIAFETSVGYNFYKRKFNAMYHRQIGEAIRNDTANR